MSTAPNNREARLEATLREVRETLAFSFADEADDRDSLAGGLIGLIDDVLPPSPAPEQ